MARAGFKKIELVPGLLSGSAGFRDADELATPARCLRIHVSAAAEQLSACLAFAWGTALQTPAANSFVDEIDPGSFRLPSLGKLGTVAARAALCRQIGETQVHRQRDTLAESDRLLGAQARQRFQHAARGVRQGRLHEAVIEVMPQAQREDRTALRERLPRQFRWQLRDQRERDAVFAPLAR